MLKVCQTKWKQNYPRFAGDRSVLRLAMFLVCSLFANVSISAIWLLPLLALTKYVIVFGILPGYLAGLIALVTFLLGAIIQLVVSLTIFGDRILTKIAEKIEQTILQAFLPTASISGSPAAVRIVGPQFYYRHIPSIPWIPPRAHLS